jgi:hypothetical protein
MIRCPLPPIAANPDSLRQFYRGGQTPQMRLLPPPALTTGTGGGTVIQNTTVVTSSSSSSSSSSAIVAVPTSITTAVLNPGQQFAGALTLSRSFQLLALTSNVAARVRLYGTASAQTQDSGRALDVAPSPGTTQNLITDVALDTAPFQWTFQNRIGANGDSPQKQTVYLTVTNLSGSSVAITLSLIYVPLEA